MASDFWEGLSSAIRSVQQTPSPPVRPTGGGGGDIEALAAQMGIPLNAPASGGGVSAPGDDDPIIFMGFGSKKVPLRTASTRTRGMELMEGEDTVTTGHARRKVPKQRRLSAIVSDMWDLGQKEYERLRLRLAAAGSVPANATFGEVQDAYGVLLMNVAEYQSQGGKFAKMTPDDFIDQMISFNGLDPDMPGSWLKQGGMGEEKPKPYTTVSTVRSVYDMSPEEAETTLKQHIKNLVGRNPTKAEIGDYINAVQTAARKSPTVQRQVTKHRPEGGRTTTMVDEQDGFDEAEAVALAEERAMEAPDYGSYQAVATYFPALQQLLGATA